MFGRQVITPEIMPASTLDPVQEAIDRLESGIGPHRILRDMHGKATAPRDDADWLFCCHCVLVRADGWSIGCRRDLYDAARELWPGQWVATICYANTQHKITIKLSRE